MDCSVGQIDEYRAGTFYTDKFRDGRSWNGSERNVLLRHEGLTADGKPKFAPVGFVMGADAPGDSRGMAIADFDNDGDLDLVINHNPGDCGLASVPATLLRNNVGSRRNWLGVELTGKNSNRDAVGAVVELELAGGARDDQAERRMRHVSAGCGYASQNSHRLHFGLGDFERIASLRVCWPDGSSQTFDDLGINQIVRIVQHQPTVATIAVVD